MFAHRLINKTNTGVCLALLILFAHGVLCGQTTDKGKSAIAATIDLWRDPALNERIDQNIEKYRKGDATIELVNPDGTPVRGAKLTIRQIGHEFLFGSNTFVLGQLKDDQERIYEEAFLKLFNFTTVPFYWQGTEPVQGELRYTEPARDIWRRPPPDRFLAWAEKHGITLKGHPLLWHLHNPDWLPTDPEELKTLYRKRFKEIAERYGDKIHLWDGVNESLVCRPTYPLLTPDRGYVEWAFREIEKVFPSNDAMLINEVTSYNFPPREDDFYRQIKELLHRGTKIDGIGFQYHFFRRQSLDEFLAGPLSDPNKLLAVYDKFCSFGLPLYITEITIPSAGEGGAALQEELVRAHYRLWFSVQRMAGITWWNLGDGTAVQGENEAEGGLLDVNFLPKPAYRALDKLINEDWTTRAQLQTDPQGRASYRGFFGRYQIDVAMPSGGMRQFTVEHRHGGTGAYRLVIGSTP